MHTAEASFLVRVTMRELVQRLDPERFEQVHRSHIVNLSAVRHLQPLDDRRLLVVLGDGTRIPASRSASARIPRAGALTASPAPLARTQEKRGAEAPPKESS